MKKGGGRIIAKTACAVEMKFEFDPAKSASNKQKHGIDFVEAQALWRGHTVEFKSAKPGERRYLLVGKNWPNFLDRGNHLSRRDETNY